MHQIDQHQYKEFIKEIKDKILESQYEALKQVNKALIGLYWEIGKTIVERQEMYEWGKSIVENLAKDLQNEFPGIQGFSSRNLWYMRNFYSEYQRKTKLQPLVAEISWSHNVVIMDKCKDDQEKFFYIQMSKKFGWSRNVLVHQIEGNSYEKYLLNQTNFDLAVPEKYRNQAKLAIKNDYNFSFLEIGEEHYESEVELGLLKNIRKLLHEMGNDFSYMGNQYRIELEGDEFYIDLLFYHRRLKSMIAIELKTGMFKPEHAGKMQFYLSVLDSTVKHEDENSSIGIIICKSKNRTVVEYALKQMNSPIGVATYTVTEKLPEDMKKYLPSPEEIIDKLSVLIENIAVKQE